MAFSARLRWRVMLRCNAEGVTWASIVGEGPDVPPERDGDVIVVEEVRPSTDSGAVSADDPIRAELERIASGMDDGKNRAVSVIRRNARRVLDADPPTRGTVSAGELADALNDVLNHYILSDAPEEAVFNRAVELLDRVADNPRGAVDMPGGGNALREIARGSRQVNGMERKYTAPELRELARKALESPPIRETAEPGARYVRTTAEDGEVTELLRGYDRAVARLAELGVDVKARDRANDPDKGRI